MAVKQTASLPIPLESHIARTLDLDVLHAFVTVVRCASFTEAAKNLGRSQSGVSMQMRRLEDQLGRLLLVRQPGRIIPTDDGQRLLTIAQEMLMLNHRAFNINAEGTIAGRISVGSIEQYARAVLPRVVAEFCRRHPEVSIEIETDTSTVMRSKLGKDYDLVISIGASGAHDGIVLDRSPVVWVTSKRHEVHLQSPLPLALQVEGTLLRGWATRSLDAAGRPWRVAYSSSSMAAIEAAVLAGLAVGVFKRDTISSRVRVLGTRNGFPNLPHAEVVITTASAASSATELLRDSIVKAARARAALK